jgi:hypothetical protein
MFKGDGNTIPKFKVGMCVRDVSPSLKKQILLMQSCPVWRCSACETLRKLQDLNAKNMLNPVSWTMAWSSLESCCFARAEMTNMVIAF